MVATINATFWSLTMALFWFCAIYFQVVIVTGDTGCGKSTQVPQYILEDLVGASYQSGIICTQPRRIAAKCISEQVALEQNCQLGDRIGFVTRQDKVCSPDTKLLFATDGVLLTQLSNPQKVSSRYNYFILGKVHERHLFTDLIISLIYGIISKSSTARVVLMRATVDTSIFVKFFSRFYSKVIHMPAGVVSMYRYFTSQRVTWSFPSPSIVLILLLSRTCPDTFCCLQAVRNNAS